MTNCHAYWWLLSNDWTIIVWGRGLAKCLLPLCIISILLVLRKSSSTWTEQNNQKNPQCEWRCKYDWWLVLWQCESTFILHWYIVNIIMERAMPVIFCGKTWSFHIFKSMMVLWEISIATPRHWWHIKNNAGPPVVSFHHLLYQSIFWMWYS